MRISIQAARTRDQGRIIWDFVAGFAASLPLELRNRLIYRRAPRLEIEFECDGGGHVLRVIAADGKSALGGAPTMAILDERGHWALDRGDELEHALVSGLGKRGAELFSSARLQATTHIPFHVGSTIRRRVPSFKSIGPRRDCLPMIPKAY